MTMAGPAKNDADTERPADSSRISGVPPTKAPAESFRLEPRAGQLTDLPGNSGSPAKSRIGTWLVYALHGFAWLVTLSLIVAISLRLTYYDACNFLTCLNAFTRYLYLPAYLCLAWAIWKRRSFLALANVAIVCFHISMVAPDFIRDRRFDPPPNDTTADTAASPTIRIFFANVRAGNNQYAALLKEVQDANPDVIVFVEFSPNWRQAYLNLPFFNAYPYGNRLKLEALGTASVFSRLPLKSETEDWIAGRGLQTLEIPVGDQTLHLIGLHGPRPMNVRSDDYKGFWESTIPKIQSEKGPLVVVGDFNATQFSKVYQQLTADRLRSAHEDRGRGYATTWPNGQYGVPSVIRIDQALLSPEVECVGVKEGNGLGSDHQPLIVDVRVRPKP